MGAVSTPGISFSRGFFGWGKSAPAKAEDAVNAFFKGDNKQARKVIRRLNAEELEWQDSLGNTVLHWAIERDDTEAAIEVAQKMNRTAFKLKNQWNNTALGVAVNRFNPQVVAALKERMAPEDFRAEGAVHLKELEEDKAFTRGTPWLGPLERDRLVRVSECIKLFE